MIHIAERTQERQVITSAKRYGVGAIFAVLVLAIIVGSFGWLLMSLFIGIPMMVFAAALAVLSPFAYFLVYEGPCPHCGARLIVSASNHGVTCKDCRHRVIFERGLFRTI